MKKFTAIIFSLMLLFVGGAALGSSAVFAEEIENPLTEVMISNEQDFINKFSMQENYSGKRIVLTQNLDFSNFDLSEIYSNGFIFSGEFDGDGWTISNITISSASNCYGLFSQTQDAVIHNLKLNGIITYKFNASTEEVFVGAILGRGELTIIENCEISENTSYMTYNEVENLDYLQFTTKVTFGGMAGCLENGGEVKNSVNLASTTLDVNLNTSTTVKYGGIVGRLWNSSAMYCVNYGHLTYNARNAYINIYNGGIVGEIEGSSAKIINCAFNGEIKEGEMGNLANGNNGAIVGWILENSPQWGNIAFDYWTKDYEGIGSKGSYEVISDHVKQVSSLSLQFFMDETNWSTLEPKWNFDTVWIVGSTSDSTVIHLQCFESFEFKISSQPDTGSVIERAVFANGTAAQEYRYGLDVILTINFQASHQGYYSLRQVLLNSTVLSSELYTAEPIENIQGQILGYTIITKATGLTEGTYSFVLQPISFECEVETENIDKGDVRFRSGSNGSARLNLTLTYASAPQTIVATAKAGSIYTFDYWDLYYYGIDGWELYQSRFSTNTNLEIDFGTAPYNQRFKLIACFTDSEAIYVTFTKDSNIDSIKFRGIEYENDEIPAPSNSNVELVVVTKRNYELNEQRFISNIATMYGESGNTDNLVRSKETDEETGMTTYVFSINMRLINDYLNGSHSLTFNLSSEEVQNENDNDLLWLWIVLPIAGVLIIGGIIAFVVIRKYRYKHGAGKFGGTKDSKGKGQAKQEKTPKQDFKDFYY